MILISGFYRSGVGLVSEGIQSCGGDLYEGMKDKIARNNVEERDFLGLNPKEKEWEEKMEELFGGQYKEAYVPCHFHKETRKKFYTQSPKEKKINIVVYRPLEQLVDSITREGIKSIYMNKKAIGRILALRKFNKYLPQLQLKIKANFIAYYAALQEEASNKDLTLLIINSANFQQSFPQLIRKINSSTDHKLELKTITNFYNADQYTQQKAIDTYRDKSLNKIHSFFK